MMTSKNFVVGIARATSVTPVSTLFSSRQKPLIQSIHIKFDSPEHKGVQVFMNRKEAKELVRLLQKTLK